MTTVSTPSATQVKIILDGKETLIPAGTTILRAARKNGIRIPTLCWLGKVKPIGACRVCSVEVEGVASPVMSCTTPVVEGMNITTQSEKLEKYRRDMIRFILVRHPLDCPVCERSGECKLQNLTYRFGIKQHVWKIDDYKKLQVKDWGLIRYDKNLCVLCERCVKICREVQGRGDLKIDGNGFKSRINTVTGEKLDCDFCGQCISVCPVGALSSGIILSARSWEMEKKKAVCPHCSVGCTLYLNVKKGGRVSKDGRIVRVTSGNRTGHNKGNLCIRGRFGYEFIQSENRITEPLVRRGDSHVATDWNSALSLIVEKFSEIKSRHDKKGFAGISSERATNEDNYVFRQFFRETLGGDNVDSMADILTPLTTSGLFKNFGDFPMTCSFDELRNKNLFVFIGAGGSVENPVVSNHIRHAMMAHGAEVVTAGSMEPDFQPSPRIRLVYEYTRMHGFMLSLLGETVKSISEEGTIKNAIPLSSEWSGKLANEASEKADEPLKLKITELVRLIRKQGNPLYIVGREAQRHPQAGAILQNIVNMAKLTGGGVMLLREQCNTQGAMDMGFGEKETDNESQDALLNRLESDEISALVIMEEDPLARYPDALRFKKAMQKAKFIVVADQFYNRSCLEADVILPTCVTAEKSGSFTNIEGRVQSFEQALEKPLGRSRAPWEIFAELADRMGGGSAYKNSGEISARISEELPMYGKAKSDGGLVDYSALITGKPSLLWTHPVPMKLLAKDSTFILLPYMQLSGGTYSEYCPTMTRLYGKPGGTACFGAKQGVRFNREDAERLALSEGDTVVFKNSDAEWKGKVEISSKIKTGCIGIPDYMDSYPAITLFAGGKEAKCVNSEWLKGVKC